MEGFCKINYLSIYIFVLCVGIDELLGVCKAAIFLVFLLRIKESRKKVFFRGPKKKSEENMASNLKGRGVRP